MLGHKMPPFYPESERPLQIPYGMHNGKIVTPEEAPHGLSEVTCLECDELLIAAQGKQIRPYFRHQSDTLQTCSYAGEGIRHRLAKLALAERMRGAINGGTALPVNWRCDCPQKHHSGNLVKVASSIRIDDTRVGPYQPDIAIFDDIRCRTFVEIEQTHASTDAKLHYCVVNDIAMATIVIREVLDPVALVRQTPLQIESSVCPYRLDRVCHCGRDKPAKTYECIACLRRRNGIDVDIAGSYSGIEPRMGTWAAIVTDADGGEYTYRGESTTDQSSMLKMLRGALLKLEHIWYGTYEVRVHSPQLSMGSQEGEGIFVGRAKSIRYWRYLKDSKGTGKLQTERVGHLVTDRPTLDQAAKLAHDQLQLEKRARRAMPHEELCAGVKGQKQ